MNKEQKWLRLANRLLDKSDHPQYRVAAVLVKGGKVISYGTNKHRPAWRWIRNRSLYELGRHAEIRCILNRSRRSIRGAVLYVVGDTVATGHRITTKPCTVCHRILAQSGIAKVVFQVGETTGAYRFS